MKTHPMLFSGPMIRALLDGRKTQTRRILKLPDWALNMDCTGRLHVYQPDEGFERHGLEFADRLRGLWDPVSNPTGRSGAYLRVPIMTGDLIWVRETWNAFSFSQDGDEAWPTKTIPTADEMQEIRDMACRVDVQAVYQESDRAQKWFSDQKWRPGIHMPRWASRITLEVTDVRVQRLQDISAKDATEEGIERLRCDGLDGFRNYLSSDPMERVAMIPSFKSLWNSINGPGAWDQNPWIVAYSFKVHKKNVDELALT